MKLHALVLVALALAVGAATFTLHDATPSTGGTSTGAEEAPAGYVPVAEHEAALGALARALDRLDLVRAKVADVRAAKRKANRARKAWKRKAGRLHRRLHPYSSTWKAAALCVKSGEGAWDTSTGNGYYGGMQMDLAFQRAYGRRWLDAIGTANRWHPDVQLLVAYRGFVARGGWNPWPNTARACGLPLFVS